MLTLILAESSIELIPKVIVNDPSIISDAKKRRKKPEQLILDRSYHHKAINRLSDPEKRGRPDIIHITLLNCLGSPLNLTGRLTTYVHTFEDFIIEISSRTRIPRNSERFKGIMEQLFESHRVPTTGKPLLQLRKSSLKELIKKVAPSYVGALTTQGKYETPTNLGRLILNHKRPVLIIGGFSKGHFTKETLKLADQQISIFPKGLESWTVASKMIFAYEQALEFSDIAGAQVS
jgi:rRNA small subunit pseudouridine methyltransferase Nep1